MITRELLLDLFVVDIEGGKLYWRCPPKNHPRLLNQEAGVPRRSHSGKEYWVIKINRKAYKRGHLLFFLSHGHMPNPCLDHIDGNSLNDANINLRQATVGENAQNHKKRAKKSNLPMGVRVIAGSGRYAARIGFNKQQISLGAFDTAEEASAVYQTKRKEYFGEFA